MIIPEQRPPLNPAPLMRVLIRAAWNHGYIAAPRDGGAYPTVLLTPRTGVQSARRGRLHLAAHGPHAALRWYWTDTGRPLGADPDDEKALIAEIDQGLTGGGSR